MHTPTAFILRCATSPCRHYLSRFPSYPLAPSFPPLNDSFSYTLKTHLFLARFYRRSSSFSLSFPFHVILHASSHCCNYNRGLALLYLLQRDMIKLLEPRAFLHHYVTQLSFNSFFIRFLITDKIFFLIILSQTAYNKYALLYRIL